MQTVEITYRCEPGDVRARPHPLSGEAARLRLDEGNRAFALLFHRSATEDDCVRHIIQVDPHDLGLSDGKSEVPLQRPFAAILACSDARVPVELVFNEGPNDVFVARVAGNVLGAEVLGSLQYAVENLSGSVKLIAVVGHSGCGAVSAAVNVFLNPENYLPLAIKHSLRDILDRLLAVVQACAKRFARTFGPDVIERPGYRKALVEAAVVTNAALTAYSIQKEFGAGDPVGLQSVYGVYLLETREVWSPVRGRGLDQPPADQAGFIQLGDAIAKSERIASLLELEG
jgi:carbonic anhydrase